MTWPKKKKVLKKTPQINSVNTEWKTIKFICNEICLILSYLESKHLIILQLSSKQREGSPSRHGSWRTVSPFPASWQPEHKHRWRSFCPLDALPGPIGRCRDKHGFLVSDAEIYKDFLYMIKAHWSSGRYLVGVTQWCCPQWMVPGARSKLDTGSAALSHDHLFGLDFIPESTESWAQKKRT